MTKLLAHLAAGGELVISDTVLPNGDQRAFQIFAYTDGTLTVRITGSGLMGPTEKPTAAGLLRLLKWIDNDAAH
jgi:hypothetical protein